MTGFKLDWEKGARLNAERGRPGPQARRHTEVRNGDEFFVHAR